VVNSETLYDYFIQKIDPVL